MRLGACSDARDVGARPVLGAAGDIDVGPCPAGAGAAAAGDDDVVAGTGNGAAAVDVLDGQVCDGDAA